MRKRVIGIGFVSVLFLCTTAWVCSAQVIGRIEYLEGTVEIVRDGSPLRPIDIGSAVEHLDQIKTRANSTVCVSFLPSSGLSGQVDLEENTTAVLRSDSGGMEQVHELQLFTGALGVKVKRLASNKSSFRVRTPTAVLGVRGTEFTVISFNGAALVACKTGEVRCDPWSSSAASNGQAAPGDSALPGRLVEVLESQSVKTAEFPQGEFSSVWKDLRTRWKTFQVELITANPVSFLNSFVPVWERSASQIEADAQRLRANSVLEKWLLEAKKGGPKGNRSSWITERNAVMKDLLAIKPHLTVGMMSWYRLNELIPHLSSADMNKKLSNGQTVQAFVNRFTKTETEVSSAFTLFYAAEKQYMLRNDGLSPFLEF